MIKMTKETLNFNKQILFSELGSLLGAPLFSYITSYFTSSKDIISSFAVAGAIIGAAVFFLGLRAYHKTRKNRLSVKEFAEDLAYFTPVAFIVTLVVYYPTIFFLSRFFQGFYPVIISVVVSQIIGFILFLIVINAYRQILIKTLGKVL